MQRAGRRAAAARSAWPQPSLRHRGLAQHARAGHAAPRASMAPQQATAAEPDLATARVAVATTAACPYCKRAKEALTELRVPFAELSLQVGHGQTRLSHDTAA
jgi:hypothetical protein